MAAPASSRWPAPALRRMEQLWRQGLTAADIATSLTIQFGARRTRSAVLGQLRRLGHDGQQARPSLAPEPAPPVARQPYVFSPLVAPAERPIEGYALQDLPLCGCRYPITADRVLPDRHRFCGDRAAAGQPYCAEHCLQAYTDRGEGGVSRAELQRMRRNPDAIEPRRPHRAPAPRDAHGRPRLARRRP
ncbi:GcrA family cell cycle regulator [Methylobacterium oryzisoli]|uniref:GcrA family cell cycle regulator n=1 Tax=Methylobacterium oryzisoli TaxID=3385502 RepID=UPI00389211C0